MEREKTFESALQELETIVKELESGNVDLDKAINKYTEAMKLAKFCSEKLNDAKIIGFTHAMSIRMLELYSKHILPDDPYKALVAYKKHRESRRVNNCESFTWKVK